jgi:hypothetical protein
MDFNREIQEFFGMNQWTTILYTFKRNKSDILKHIYFSN